MKFIKKIKIGIECIKTLVNHPSRVVNVLKDGDDFWERYVKNKYHISSGLSSIELPLDGAVYPFTTCNKASTLTDLSLLKNLAKRYQNCSI